jgi:hypothetical protein
VRDRVQPCPEAVYLRATHERSVGLQQSILHRFLGVRVSDELRAVPDERAPVAVHDRLERGLGAEPRELGQALVPLHTQRQPGQAERGHESRIHELKRTIGPLR